MNPGKAHWPDNRIFLVWLPLTEDPCNAPDTENMAIWKCPRFEEKFQYLGFIILYNETCDRDIDKRNKSALLRTERSCTESATTTASYLGPINWLSSSPALCTLARRWLHIVGTPSVKKTLPANEAPKYPSYELAEPHHQQRGALSAISPQDPDNHPSLSPPQGGWHVQNAPNTTCTYHPGSRWRTKTTLEGSIEVFPDLGQHRGEDMGNRCWKWAFLVLYILNGSSLYSERCRWNSCRREKIFLTRFFEFPGQ